MTSADLKRKIRSGHKIRANCPSCCPDTEGRATFHQGWEGDRDCEADPMNAVWRCGNCGFEVARRVRRSPAQIMLERIRAEMVTNEPNT